MKRTLITSFIIFILSTTFLYGEERWEKYLADVRQTDGLAACFSGDDFLESGERSAEKMLWNGKTPWKAETLPSGIRYISLDDSSLTVPALELFRAKNEDGTPVCRAFSVEVRLRQYGQGTQLGGGGTLNGMIFCQGNGYWEGVRLVCDTNSGNVSLNIGRKPSCAGSSSLNPYMTLRQGVWHHVCATWDGSKACVYIDGILSGYGTYDGPFVPDGNDFRLGNGGAGVGTLKMDVCSCAVFSRALTPEEVFRHACALETLTDTQKDIINTMTRFAAEKQWPAFTQQIQDLQETFLKNERNNENKENAKDLKTVKTAKNAKDKESTENKKDSETVESSVLPKPETVLQFQRIFMLRQCGRFAESRKMMFETLRDTQIPSVERAQLGKMLLPADGVRVFEILPKDIASELGKMRDSGLLKLTPHQTLALRESCALETLADVSAKKSALKTASEEFAALSDKYSDVLKDADLDAKRWEMMYRQGLALFRAENFTEASAIFRTLAGRVSEGEKSTGPGVVDLIALRRGAAREMYNKAQAAAGSSKRLTSSRALNHHVLEESDWKARQNAHTDAARDTNPGASQDVNRQIRPNTSQNPEMAQKSVPDFILPSGHTFGLELEVSDFTQLEAARDRLREYKQMNDGKLPAGGVKIVILPGIYRVTQTFTLEKQDAGTAETPILYTVKDPKKTVFTGGLNLTNYAVPLADSKTDSEVKKRLTREAAGEVYCVNLSEVPEFKEVLNTLQDGKLPALKNRGGGSGPDAAPWVQLYAVQDADSQDVHTGHHAELFTLARYPNTGFLNISDVTQGLWESENAWKKAIFTVKEPLNAPRLEAWKNAPDPWLYGSWTALWTLNMMPLEDVEVPEKTLHAGGPNVRKDYPFFVLNVLEELDAPGEWFLDRETQTVYFWKDTYDAKNAQYWLSLYDQPFVVMKEAAWTAFEGFTMEFGTRCAVKIESGDHNTLVDCTLRNFGTWGVVLNGVESGLYACNLMNFAGGAVQMHGGKTTPEGTQPAKLFAENTEIDGFSLIDLAYTPAFHMDGAGNRVTHCKIHNSPHHVFRVEGMEQKIEFCEVYDAVYQGDDQGAVDMWANPALRGTLFRGNYWHHIGTGCLDASYGGDAPSMTDAQRAKRARKLANHIPQQNCGQGGIRLDDAISSVVITGNVFQECSSKNFGCVQIHGGKDNIIDNNLFIGSVGCVSLSPWTEERWLDSLVNKCYGFMKNVTGISDFSNDGMCPLMEKYPDLLTLKENANRNFFTRNLVLDCKDFFLRDTGVNAIFSNTILSADAKNFCSDPDRERDGFLRFRLPYDSPLFNAAGMLPIPMEEIGLYRDGKYRK